MKRNRIISSLLSCCTALGCVPFAADAAVPVVYPADNGYSSKEIAASDCKPKLTVSHEVITDEEAKASPERTVTLKVADSQNMCEVMGIHIYFDDRLTAVKDKVYNMPQHTRGSVIEDFSVCELDYDKTASDAGMNGVFLTAVSMVGGCDDGNIISFKVKLPDDVRSGDVYPIDIVYRSNENAVDLFSDSKRNTAGMLMQSYTFTQGIYNPEYNCNFKASAEDTAKCAALADIGGDCDGYIAIADEIKVTYGDANCDGKITIADSTAILQHLGNEDKYGLSEQGKRNADVDGKKGVTGNDAITIQMVDAKMLTVDQLPLK